MGSAGSWILSTSVFPGAHRLKYDAVIVGAGPNGLSAAIELARAGLRVHVFEAQSKIGGGARSLELTLPGFIHDPFSAIHPLAVGSPFLSRLPLGEYGLQWIHPPAPLAHPFDDTPAAVLERSLDGTATRLGTDGEAYSRLMAPFVDNWEPLSRDVLAPPFRIPDAPLVMASFGFYAIRSARQIARRTLHGGRAAALFAGSAAHAGLSLRKAGSAAFGLMLSAAGHKVGWPIPAGGAGEITRAMGDYLVALGGTIQTDAPVHTLDELPPADAVMLDLTPRQILEIADDRLPPLYRSRLRRFRYGLGVFKMDWALSDPIPWRDAECERAGTVHLGGSAEEVIAAMESAARGGIAERPFILLAQPSRFDASRAPQRKHTAWAYCHIPNGSNVDVSARIEAQIERYAPGFRETILARSALGPANLNQMNANLVGGDVNGGAADLPQLLLRPMARRDPYRTPLEGVYVCSASTSPGGGVHGMCGYHAARSALRNSFPDLFDRL